ncbi:MAG: sulfatase-like hydrolase/transferase [Chitinophagales bacterium]|nr:sulfatase-like hydrolase/transferase [Chitinophagales bacterium]
MRFLWAFIIRLFILLALYQCCRLLFFAFNYSHFEYENWQTLLYAMWGSLRFDLSALMYLNIPFLFMMLLPFPFRFQAWYQKTALWIFFIANSIGIAANIADIGYFPYILRRTNAAFFLEFKNDTGLLSTFQNFVFSHWYLWLIAIALIAILYVINKRLPLPKRESYQKRNYVFDIIALPFAVLLWLGFARGSFVPSNRPINISYAGDYASRPASVSLVVNTPFSVMMTLGNIKIPDYHFFENDEAAAKIYNPIQHYTKRDVPKKNVVVIIVESLSKEFIASLNTDMANYEGFTPFVDTLVFHSLTFKNTLANSKRSIEGLPAVVASIPSLSEAYVLTPYATNRINSLASVLNKYGYHTSFFHGAHHGSMGFTAFMKMAGFQQTFSKEDFGNDKFYDGTWGIWDEEFLQYWNKKLSSFPQPFCSVLFTVSSHHPFALPNAYKNSFKKGFLDIHPSIQYTDQALRKFFESASKEPWYKNTIFVLTADHAASFAHYPQYNNNVGVFSVPVVFFTPDSSLHGFENKTVQQQDIFPSIIDYLGIGDTITAFGKSVFMVNQNPFVVNYFAGTFQAFNDEFLLQYDGQKPIALYRYRTDRLLQENLLNQMPEKVDEMMLRLKAYLQQYAHRVRDNKMLP